MAKFAYCDWSDIVWQIDADNPAQLPVPVHSGGGNVHSLALTADKQFQMISGPSNVEIRKTTGAHGYVSTFVEPQAYQVYLSKVRMRMIGFGQERIYFSSYDTAQGAHFGEQIYQIRYLKNGVAVPYVTIYPSQLTVPNPCHPSEEMAVYLGGDFAFGDNDTLYLSSGNWGGGEGPIIEQAGVYRVDGAGPDAVTGNVQRIYLAPGPISALCYRSPNTLYFLRGFDICRLDLSTTPPTETVLCSIPPVPVWPGPRDLAYVGDGLQTAGSWVVISTVSKWLQAAATWVWKLGIAIAIRRWPKPPGPRPRRPKQGSAQAGPG